MLARIRRIEIRARRLVASRFLGEYHSVFRGRGIEFSEVRQYEPGDDVRAIDWNVTARMGAPYIKKYVEERELTVLLVVDVSASSAFTTTGVSKRELAAEVAATLAFSAAANNDRVGLIAFTDRVEEYVPPAQGSPPRAAHHPRAAVSRTGWPRHEHRRRAVVPGARARSGARSSSCCRTSSMRATRTSSAPPPLRHEVVALTLSDPREDELPDVGLLDLRGRRDGRARDARHVGPRGVRDGVRPPRRARRGRSRRRSFAAAGVEEIELRTDESYVAPLLRAFRARERRG